MSSWHAPPDVLVRWAAAPEALDDTSAFSIETHLVACAECRAVVAASADDAVLAMSWDAVADVIDRPAAGAVERLLSRVVPSHQARVVAGTPGLRLAWLGAVVAVVGAVVAIATKADNPAVFAVPAPFLPLVAIAATFGFGGQPGGEAAVATPANGFGLLLRRGLAVLVPAFVVLAVGAAFLPSDIRDARWVLPAVALTAAAVALSTWMPPVWATATAAVVWLAGVAVAATVSSSPVRGFDIRPLLGGTAQVAFAVAAAAFVAVGVVRRERLLTVGVA